MAVDDHGIEVLKKSGEEVVPGDKSDHFIKVGGLPAGSPGTIPPIPVELEGAESPLTTQVSTTASTETSHTFGSGLKQFILRTQNRSELLWSWIATGTDGTSYVTLRKGAVLNQQNLNITSAITIYFQTDSNDTVEIQEWT